MILSVILVPSGKVKKDISKLIWDLSKKFNSFGNDHKLPHVTVKFRCEVDRKELKNFLLNVKDVAKQTESFKVSTNGIGYFAENKFSENKPYTVYLKIKNNRSLTKLHMSLVEKLEKYSVKDAKKVEGKFYHPHLTLLFRDLTKKNFVKAKKELQNFSKQYSFAVSKLTVVFLNKNYRWKVVKTYKFQR